MGLERRTERPARRARSLREEFGLCHAKSPGMLMHGRMISHVLSLLLLCEEWTLGAGGEGVKRGSREISRRLWQWPGPETMVTWMRVIGGKVLRDVFWAQTQQNQLLE